MTTQNRSFCGIKVNFQGSRQKSDSSKKEAVYGKRISCGERERIAPGNDFKSSFFLRFFIVMLFFQFILVELGVKV